MIERIKKICQNKKIQKFRNLSNKKIKNILIIYFQVIIINFNTKILFTLKSQRILTSSIHNKAGSKKNLFFEKNLGT